MQCNAIQPTILKTSVQSSCLWWLISYHLNFTITSVTMSSAKLEYTNLGWWVPACLHTNKSNSWYPVQTYWKFLQIYWKFLPSALQLCRNLADLPVYWEAMLFPVRFPWLRSQVLCFLHGLLWLAAFLCCLTRPVLNSTSLKALIPLTPSSLSFTLHKSIWTKISKTWQKIATFTYHTRYCGAVTLWHTTTIHQYVKREKQLFKQLEQSSNKCFNGLSFRISLFKKKKRI